MERLEEMNRSTVRQKDASETDNDQAMQQCAEAWAATKRPEHRNEVNEMMTLL